MNQIKRFWAIEDKGEDAKAGWYAWYVLPRKPHAVTQPLIGWALMNRDGEDSIVGIVANTDTIIEADKPNDESKFVMYMQRGSWTEEQITDATKQLRILGQRFEASEKESRRNAPEVGTRGVLQTSREDGATEVRERALRVLQEEVEGRREGERTDPPLQPPDELEE